MMADYNDALGISARFTEKSHESNRVLRLFYLIRCFINTRGGAPSGNSGGPLIIHPAEKTALALNVIAKFLGYELASTRVGTRRTKRALAQLRRQGFSKEWLTIFGFAWRSLFLIERFTRGYNLRLAYDCARLIRESLNASLFLPGQGIPFVIIVSDLSPTRMAVATGANRAGVPVLYLQFAADHATPPPFLVDAALVLTDAGFDAVQKRLRPGGLIMFYDDPQLGPSTPMRASPAAEDSVRDIGISLTNFTEGRQSVADLVDEVAGRFPNARIHLRPHPSSDGQIAVRSTRAAVRPLGEPIAEFAKMCDLVVVGSSSSALKLAWHGCPVAHVGNVDDFGYDDTGYVRRGIIYGAHTVDAIDLGALRRFYASGDWSERLTAMLASRSREAEAATPAAFKAWLEERLAGVRPAARQRPGSEICRAS
jgi:hypothetical protein